MKLPRILLADDHLLITEAFRKLLEPRFEVVGAVCDGRALVETAPALKPDLIIVDISMPIINGLEAGRQLRKIMPCVKLIYLTMNEDPELATEAFRQGASGYLLKKSAATELFLAIDSALRGNSYITARIAQHMSDLPVQSAQSNKRDPELTTRQREVIQLLAEGKQMKEVAHMLNVTPRTVAFHKYHVMEQLGLKTTASLVQFAVRNHIVVE